MKRPARHRPPLTDGACAAAQSTGAAALRPILQARPLALRVHRERAIVDKSTDLWVADLHVGRALRKDNRGPRMLARTRTRRASCRPGGGRPSSPPERPCPGSTIEGGAVSVRPRDSLLLVEKHAPRAAPPLYLRSQGLEIPFPSRRPAMISSRVGLAPALGAPKSKLELLPFREAVRTVGGLGLPSARATFANSLERRSSLSSARSSTFGTKRL